MNIDSFARRFPAYATRETAAFCLAQSRARRAQFQWERFEARMRAVRWEMEQRASIALTRRNELGR